MKVINVLVKTSVNAHASFVNCQLRFKDHLNGQLQLLWWKRQGKKAPQLLLRYENSFTVKYRSNLSINSGSGAPAVSNDSSSGKFRKRKLCSPFPFSNCCKPNSSRDPTLSFLPRAILIQTKRLRRKQTHFQSTETKFSSPTLLKRLDPINSKNQEIVERLLNFWQVNDKPSTVCSLCNSV